MKKLFSLRDLLCEQVRDLYDAEENYSRQLLNFIRSATSPRLKEQFILIAENTRANISLLGRICEDFKVPAHGVVCEAMEGLVREAKDHTTDWGDSATIDAALIANAQRIVHYEIAGFGTAKEFARCVGEKDASKVLHDMLQKSFHIDQELTRLATGGWFDTGINTEAADAA